MFRRARHQKGSLQRVKRKSGQNVWIFRWYEIQPDGLKRYRKVVVGTVEEFRTKSDAQKAVDALRLTINEQTLRQQLREISFDTLVQHYRQHEMPDIFYKKSKLPDEIAEDDNRKSYATQDTYEGYLKKWILPRWKSYRLPDIKSVQVEQWLKSLALAPGSKAKIRNIMSALYSHAIRWEWGTYNPITHVRQSAKRRKTPVVLMIEQIQAFLSHLEEPCRTAVLLGASSGLRVGELLGLKWEDVDFEVLEVKRNPFAGEAEDHPLQNGSFPQGDPTGCGFGRGLAELETSVSVSAIWRLGLCQSPQEGQAAVLAGFAVPDPSQAGACSSRDCGQGRLAYAATHIRHIDEGEWRRHQDDSGIVAPFELQGHRRHLHTSCYSDEACSANQACQNDSLVEQTAGRARARRVSFSYRTLSNPRRKGSIPISSLFCWRPRRDLNPCYRRERAMS